MPERWNDAMTLFEAALERPPDERTAWLRDTCNDPALREEAEALLAAHARTGILDRQPPVPSEGLEAGHEGQRMGAYRLVREVGRGGMGVVYLAERDDGQFDQQVAVKLLPRELATEDLVRRFRNERQILASLQHPNIAPLYDGGVTEEGLPYLVMEYVEGQPIDAYCDAHDLSFNERLRLFLTAVRAVQHAHQRLIIHRDLKPTNILVTEAGTPRLLDFGLAKLLQEEPAEGAPPTRPTQRWMTLQYASPGQVKGEPLTTASDTYQLGLILYELLTGQRPYNVKGKTPSEAERIICETEPAPPSTAATAQTTQSAPPTQLRQRLKGDLDTILLKALHKDPERGYASAETMADDLERHLKGLPISARPDTWGYRAKKFVQRHRWGVGVTAMIALLLASSVVALSLQNQRIAQERDRVRVEAMKAEHVKDFLIDLFGQSDPRTARGDTATVGEVLEAGAARVQKDLADHPEIQAEMMNAIGAVYKRLGRYDDARPLLKEALATQRSLSGEYHASVASSLGDLASLEHLQGNYTEAERLFRNALTIQRKLHGEGHIEVAKSKSDLASLLHTAGRTEEAAALYAETLPVYRRVLGDGHSQTAEVFSNLGLLRKDLGDYASAETLLREALRIRRRTLEAHHPDIATSLNYLAVTLYAQGRHAESEPLLREALRIRRRVFGDAHRRTLTSMNDLAAVLYAQGNEEEATTLFRKVLSGRKKTLGSTHGLVAQSLNNLAAVLRKQGRYQEADPLFREAMDLAQKRYGRNHAKTATSIANLGALLRGMGRLRDAERWLRQSLAIRRKVLPDDHPQIAISQSELGACLTALGHFAKARPLLTQSYATLRKKTGPNHEDTRQALERLIALHDAWGRPDEAARYRDKQKALGR